MLRSEIETKYTWDLEAIFKNFDEFKAGCKQCEQAIIDLAAMKDHLSDSKDNFKKYLLLEEHKGCLLHKLNNYAMMKNDVDPDNDLNNQALSMANILVQKNNALLSFVPLELREHEVIIKEYLKDEDLACFTYLMEEIFRYTPHYLEASKEAMLKKMSEMFEVPGNTFASFRLNFPDVIVEGKPQFLNGGNYQQFLLNQDVKVRKQAFENYLGEYQSYSNVFANLLTGHMKARIIEAKMRNYPSALNASLFNDGVDEKLFELVLKMGNETYLEYAHEFFLLKKDVLKLDVQHIYDINLPIINSCDLHYTIEEAIDLLKQALLPLGEDYTSMLDVALKERWIDFYPHAKKRSGAYSSGSYGTYPYILTNFTGNYTSLSTIAHEFGHSMHSYYSCHNQRAILSQYSIFVAEAASTVNELLLSDYMLKHCDDKHIKAAIIDGLLDKLIGTLYRQTMYAQFEWDLYQELQQDHALSAKAIADHFLKLNQNYYGEGVKVDELQGYACYQIPHFYYDFYVYKYTLGMSVAIHFLKEILNGNTSNYRKFLTRGGSTSPLQTFIDAGANPYDPKLYDEAFSFFKTKLDELKSLL